MGVVNDPITFFQDEAGQMPTADEGKSRCADRWKNAGPKKHKRMFFQPQTT